MRTTVVLKVVFRLTTDQDLGWWARSREAGRLKLFSHFPTVALGVMTLRALERC
jgi:hypothetical protein